MPKKRPLMPRKEMKIHLRRWLDANDMTAEELAAQLKTSKSVISKLETGEQRWNQDWLEEVAFVFDCEVADLYFDPDRARVNKIANRVYDELAPNDPKKH